MTFYALELYRNDIDYSRRFVTHFALSGWQPQRNNLQLYAYPENKKSRSSPKPLIVVSDRSGYARDGFQAARLRS